MTNIHTRFESILLTGAAGDALGADIEFQKGLAGHYPNGYRKLGDPALITDDTQMTLFGAEAILLTPGGNPNDLQAAVWAAYQRWLKTQEMRPWRYESFPGLISRKWLHKCRAPGATCMTALRNGRPVMGSKGCGGVMRAAPFGMQLNKSPRQCFHDAADAAWLTHGHPGGYLPAGALAAIIRCCLDGLSLEKACYQALRILRDWNGSESTIRSIKIAMGLSQGVTPMTSFRKILSYVPANGAGWVGDECLGIALYAVLSAERASILKPAQGYPDQDDTVAALAIAVTHDGDSDSTGAVAGNIAGAAGFVLPTKWARRVQGRELMTSMSQALLVATGPDVRPAYTWKA